MQTVEVRSQHIRHSHHFPNRKDRCRGRDERTGTRAIDYIHKPFVPLVVQARVRTHLALREAHEQVAEEKRKLDRLLDNILPASAVAEIKLSGCVIPRRFENVAVLFSDLVGFTNYCDQQAPEDVVRELANLFVTFESCARRHGLEKIKTMGDAFLATAGLLEPVDDALHAAVSCALAISEQAACTGRGWQVRSGIHIGPVMAGIVGEERYQFDVWGDTVNVASRLTGAASPDGVGLTEQTSASLRDFAISPRGAVELKGKGMVRMVEVTANVKNAAHMKIEPASIEERPEVSTKEEKTNSDKRIILLVDDAPADIQAAQNILKDTYIIKTATSGVRALDLSKATPQPDLILLDAMMPEMDGMKSAAG